MRHCRKTGSFLILSKGVNELNGINNQIKPGCCPHGLPAGACPVCSQSGGGTLRQSDRNRKIGEMTYHECAMIGNMMKARALAQKRHDTNLEKQTLNSQQFETAIIRASQNLNQFIKFLSSNILFKPAALAIRITILPALNILRNIPKIIQNLSNFKFEITDKLAAIYGETKNFILKKTEEGLKILSSFFKKFFKTSKKNDAEDDDTKIDDDKRIFNLKTILQKLKEKFKEKDKKNERSTEDR